MYNLIMMSRKSGLDDSNRTVVHSQHGELWPRDFNVKKDHNIVLYISKMYWCAWRPITQKLGQNKMINKCDSDN